MGENRRHTRLVKKHVWPYVLGGRRCCGGLGKEDTSGRSRPSMSPLYLCCSTVADSFPASNHLDSFGRMVAKFSGRCTKRKTAILENTHD